MIKYQYSILFLYHTLIRVLRFSTLEGTEYTGLRRGPFLKNPTRKIINLKSTILALSVNKLYVLYIRAGHQAERGY